MKRTILIISITLLWTVGFCQTTIQMEKKDGVYYVPCKLNGLALSLIFDTGADDVSISLTEAVFMIKNGYMKEEDLIGSQYYQIANGDIVAGTKIVIRELEIGGKTLTNVSASIVRTLSAPLLLGQSALSRFGTFSVDYATNTLTLGGSTAINNNSQTNPVINQTKPIVDKKESYIPPKSYKDNCKYPNPIPKDISETITSCNQLYLEGKFSECAIKYDALITKYPDYCVGYYNRGLAKFYSGDKIGAKVDFDNAIKLGYGETQGLVAKLYGQ